MIRVLACIVRRPDVPRDAFRRHYEETHAPLAQSILPPFAHYLRNHVVAGDVPFDVMTEFGYGSAEIVAELDRVLGSEAGAPIRADELTFMDTAKNGFFGVRALEEPGRAPLDARARERTLLLASAPSGEDAADFSERWIARFAEAVPADVDARHFASFRVAAPPLADVVSVLGPRAASLDAELDALGEIAGALHRVRVETEASIRAEGW